MSAITGRIAGVNVANVATRYGIKGANAAAWLAQHGIAVPAAPNRIVTWNEAGGGRCLRLGNSEFLVEHDAPGAAPLAGSEGAWQLLRSDHSIVLDGAPWPRELAQVCAFDFSRLEAEPDLVVMTLLAGIGVTLVREPRPAHDTSMALRLWCDASYATYLNHCLQHLARSDHPSGESP